jgi:putative ABC transport system permease protein
MAMSYTLSTLWYERQRYLPGVLATAFSALLVALQCGLLLGMFSFVSLPVDHTRAHIWVGGPNTPTVDRGYPIPADYVMRVAAEPEVERCEVYIQGFAYWVRGDGGAELSMVIGARLEYGALGCVAELTPELRDRLREPGAVVVDESDLGRLGVRGVGDGAEIGGRRVRVAGMVRGTRGLAGAYVFCSVHTARQVLGLRSDQATYLLARCRDAADAPAVAARLRSYPTLSATTSGELSLRSRLHWLTKTKAGMALGAAAALGLLVGAVVTSQTLAAATAASLREYTVLWALGIPRRRMVGAVLAQAFCVGTGGVTLALPAVYALAWAADEMGVGVLLPGWLLAGTLIITLGTALLSGVLALRTLWRMEPATLLRC